MKYYILIFALTFSMASQPVLRAETPATAGQKEKVEKPETELEKTMNKMGKAWRQVRKAARDGKLSPATAPLVATVRVNAEAAIKLTPALEAEKPAEARAKFQADYEAQLRKLVAALEKLEQALAANDSVVAAKLVADIGDMSKSGHHSFRKPEEKH